MVERIRVGARGSTLSRIQAKKVIKIFEKRRIKCEFIPIKTTGDIDKKTPLYKMREKGAFVKAIENAIYENKIDIAVHSAKDVPTEIPEGLEIACYLKREFPSDVIVCNYKNIEEIPEGAKLGTGSIRRQFFLKSKRPDFVFLPLRGNIETRIRRWKNGEFEAIIMTKAAIKRLGLNLPYIILGTHEFPPAPGQGAICIEIRKGSKFYELLREINDKKTETEVNIERELLKKIGGGCSLPFGCFAEIKNSEIHLRAMYVKGDTIKKITLKGKNEKILIQRAYEELK